MPLECEQIRNEFSALLDDELNSEDRELVEEHLSDCSDCLRELHGYQQVSDAYRYHHPVKAPADFEARLRERMSPSGHRHRLTARSWISLAAAAGVTLVAGVVLWQKPLPEQTAFQLSKNESESIETAPMAEELAPAPLNVDSAAPAMEDRVVGRRATADEPQMSAFSAAAPETDLAEERTTADAQDALPAPAEPQMRQFIAEDEGTAAMESADDSALAMKSAPLAAGADEAPAVVGRSRVMSQPPAADAENPPEALRAAPESPQAEPAPESQQNMARGSGFGGGRTEASETAAREPARKDEATTLQWRERTFILHDGKWRQEDYASEETIRVLVPSDPWNKLLDEYQDLNKLVSKDEPVVVKLGETWYDIRRAEATPETTSETPAAQGR